MGPLVEGAVDDLRKIQRSLCQVSPAGTHGGFKDLFLTQERILGGGLSSIRATSLGRRMCICQFAFDFVV